MACRFEVLLDSTDARHEHAARAALDAEPGVLRVLGDRDGVLVAPAAGWTVSRFKI